LPVRATVSADQKPSSSLNLMNASIASLMVRGRL